MKYLLNLRLAIGANRVILGLFFVLSGIANYLHFSDRNGFYHTVLTQKLQLLGPGIPPGWTGIGPLPEFFAVPYAWLLPLAEIGLGALFAFNYRIRWTGLLLILMTFSIILAFGIVPAGSLFPNASESFNKNVMFMSLIWVCIAYDAHERKLNRRRKDVSDRLLASTNTHI